MRKRIDLIGKRFNKLLVLSFDRKDKYNHLYWLCKCDCGNEIIVRGDHITRNEIQSCGCYNAELNIKRGKQVGKKTKHNLSKHRLYCIWTGMKTRCYNKKSPNYKWYGAKNILVCNEWKNNFQEFYNWAIENGYKDDLTIDRINTNGNYEPSNCRWVDNIEQSNNKSNNHYITYNNEIKTLSQWSEIVNISRDTLYDRINKKHWDIEKAFTTPVRDRKLKER